jgi:hypothetical protein
MATIEDELAVQRVLSLYCQRCDDGDHAGVAALWAPDGELLYDGELIVGHAALEVWFAQKSPPDRRGKHLTTNVVVDVDGDRAAATSDYAFLRIEDGVIAVPFAGRYVDALARIDGTWRLTRRAIVLLAPPGSAVAQ